MFTSPIRDALGATKQPSAIAGVLPPAATILVDGTTADTHNQCQSIEIPTRLQMPHARRSTYDAEAPEASKPCPTLSIA